MERLVIRAIRDSDIDTVKVTVTKATEIQDAPVMYSRRKWCLMQSKE